MTALAGSHNVHAVEWKRGKGVIKADLREPAIGGMTCGTILTQLPSMCIGRPMAAHAFTFLHRQRIRPGIDPVAIVAAQFPVASRESELSLKSMIEARRGPLIGLVTAFTVIAEPGVMNIDAAVTADATRRHLLCVRRR